MLVNFKRKDKIKINIFLKLIAGILILVVFCLIVLLYQFKTSLNKSAEEKVFIIAQGQSLKEIAKSLEEQDIIRSEKMFILYVWLKGKTENLQAGKYNLSSSMDISKIAKKIIQGKVIQDWIKVTIPEGWTNKQIEERLGKKLPIELQGYLFPDTYYFEKDATAEEIIKKMRDNFDKKVNKDIEYDILKMASILEKEVRSDEDRAIVSGIFWRRLESNYPLESCATIAYVLGVDKWRYSIEETKIKSPYNTYINIGLPPTPINNPGLSAIRAAIYPKETDYNFFLTAPDGTTIFSKTFNEHNANKKKYFETLDNLFLE